MTGPDFKDHFSTRSVGYAASRPDYPREVGAYLAEQSPGRQLALDCGCGNGQLSVLLAEHFEQVVATDASTQQIAAAKPHPRIDYRVAPAEASGLESDSADLIVAAQAAHWFDLDAFYSEVRRVAKPGALLALITYGVFDVEGDANGVVQDFYWKTIHSHWPPERRHVEDGYSSLAFPFTACAVPDLAIERRWTSDQFLAYIDTWSAVRAAEKAEGRGMIEDFAKALAVVWPDGQAFAVRWPLSIRAGRVGDH